VSAPIRTCAGCGRKAPQAELVRFVAREGTLAQAPKGQGRGAYTCFERAATRNAFSRILRRRVQVDPELRRLYTDADG
jgi:predicted RNA-binding protein YlxR (DUF448 family)